VDFYSATVYHTLGIPLDQFVSIFAISRVAGWTAHVIEHLEDNILIRPRARYVGELDRPFVPLDQRS
jgi:citrate synthase